MYNLFFTVDNKLRILTWSKKLEKMVGRSSFEIQGSPYHEIFPRISSGNDIDAVSKVIEEDKPTLLEGYKVLYPNGMVEKNIFIEPLKTRGKVVGARVKVGPFETQRAPKRRQGPQFKDYKIASTLAHGVRNPLNAIKGAAVYLKEKYASDETLLEFTKIIEEEILRLDNFITKFLSNMALSDEELSSTNINSLLRVVEILTSFQTHTRNIKATYECGDLPLLEVDSFRLENAILNIVNNAIEAMPKGGHLCVRSGIERHDDRLYTVIEVSDTGPGMALIKGENLAQHRSNRGRGYGLTITREVIRSHGGYMEIKSKKGYGTTIRLYLPVTDVEGERIINSEKTSL
jgi:two-component system nitrogen regulation sensor histidine kinase GlnL